MFLLVLLMTVVICIITSVMSANDMNHDKVVNLTREVEEEHTELDVGQVCGP